jgi:Mor family transcriptional regulator
MPLLKKEGATMRYQNAGKLLPEALLKEVQRYAAGEILYVPVPERKRRGGGEIYRQELAERNSSIGRDWRKGISVAALAERYYLSKKSIQRILRNEKRKEG